MSNLQSLTVEDWAGGPKKLMLAQVKTLGQELDNLPQQISKEWADRQIYWINRDVDDWASRLGQKQKFKKVTKPHFELLEKLEAIKPTLPSNEDSEIEPPLFMYAKDYHDWLHACLENAEGAGHD